ncbi:MAG: peroxiredoxin-like family protein [Pseudomonadota bacterium]
MKTKLLVLFVAVFATASVLAFDRTEIRASAEEVTPLLNGMAVPNVKVQTTDGDPLSLHGLFMQKPTVVVFYRGGWCPYCTRQLAGLKDIEQDLVDAGYQIVAISPETPEMLQSQKLKTEFSAQLISDADLNAIRAFGVGFYVPDPMRKRLKDKANIELAADDSERGVLPAPAVFIVDSQARVLFSYVNPDYTVRPSAELVLSAAKLVKQ